MDLRGPISGETGYVIAWFSHRHSQESARRELRRRDCESPSLSAQLARLKSLIMAVTSTLTLIILLLDWSQTAVCVHLCVLVRMHFRHLCVCGIGCFSVCVKPFDPQYCHPILLSENETKSKPKLWNWCKARQGQPLCHRGYIWWQLVYYQPPHFLSTSVTAKKVD